MSAMPTIGPSRQPPLHASVHEEQGEYVIELDVSDFVVGELTVEVLGSSVVVRARKTEDDGPFALSERLEETMRLPDDVDPDGVTAVHRHGTLELRVRRRKIPHHEVRIEREFLVSPTPKGC